MPIDVQRAFSLDAFVTSHPVQVTVGHPDEINEVFDTISYAKVCQYFKVAHCIYLSYILALKYNESINNICRDMNYRVLPLFE